MMPLEEWRGEAPKFCDSDVDSHSMCYIVLLYDLSHSIPSANTVFDNIPSSSKILGTVHAIQVAQVTAFGTP